MATFTTFEEISAWKKAHESVLKIYKLTNETKLKRDFGLKDQMRRAAVSITSNIAEGHDRGTKNQFVYFLNVSRGSCSELRSQLILAKDLNYIEVTDCEKLKQDLMEVSRMIMGLIKYLKSLK
jgi:four helix bundle protein